MKFAAFMAYSFITFFHVLLVQFLSVYIYIYTAVCFILTELYLYSPSGPPWPVLG
jgi:hypothetical protein